MGSGPVPPSQAAAALGLPLIAVIADDRAAASALRGEPVSSWRLARSALVDSVRELAAALLDPLTSTTIRSDPCQPIVCRDRDPQRTVGRSDISPSVSGFFACRVKEADVVGASAFASSVPVTLAANEADL